MRLKIIMECKQGEILNYNYNYNLFKVITGAVQKTKTLLPNRCHDSGLFTFSQLVFDQYCISQEGIQNLGDCVHWYISSPKVFFLDGILKGLKEAGKIQIGSTSMPIQGIEVVGDPDISDVMEFSCMSPITVTSSLGSHEGHARYGRIEDNDFAEKIRRDLVSKYYLVHDSLPANEDLEITFNQRYISNKRRVSRLVDYNGIKILSYMIPFKVRGNPELIRIGYQLGFGHKNNCGFGMVKVWHPPVYQEGQDSVAG